MALHRRGAARQGKASAMAMSRVASAQHNDRQDTMDTRVCAHCGQQLQRRQGEAIAAWTRRRYCSSRCVGQAHAAAIRAVHAVERTLDSKPCAHCGATIRRLATDGETPWRLKRYCSKQCGAAAHWELRRGAEYTAAPRALICDCGNPAVRTLWIVQGSAEGKLLPVLLSVCADCADLWMEDGATEQAPIIQPATRLWGATGKRDYPANGIRHLRRRA